MRGAVAVRWPDDWERTEYEALVDDRTEYERFVDWCFAGTPENTQPSAEVQRVRDNLRQRKRDADRPGYIGSPEDIEAAIARMVARAKCPEYQRLLQEDRERDAALEEANRQRWAERRKPPKTKAKAKGKRKREARKQAKAEARAMKDDGLTIPQIMEHLGVSRATVFRWLREGETTQ